MPIDISENVIYGRHRAPTYRSYDVTIDGFTIDTIVTSNGAIADNWISEIHSTYEYRPLIGLDVEWRPSFNILTYNPVAIIQVCVDDRCLIYQIYQNEHNSYPRSQWLYHFFTEAGHKFVGVGIEDDVEKLGRDYGLEVWKYVDLRDVAIDQRPGEYWTRDGIGLKRLAEDVLRVRMEKPALVTTSNWDEDELSLAQVQYAVADAYACYGVGIVLSASHYC